MPLHERLQGLVHLDGTGIGITDLRGHLLFRRGGLAGYPADFHEQFFHGNLLHPDAQLVQEGDRIGLAGDEPVGGLADDADAHALQPGAGLLDLLQRMDPFRHIGVASVQDLAFQPLLAQVGKDFQRGGEGIALAGRQEVIAFDAPGEHLRQQSLEDALRTAGTDVDKVERMRAEIGEIGSPEHESVLLEHAFQEFVGESGHGGLVVETGGDGIYGDHGD